MPSERAALYAKAFPDFPPLRADDRWLDGMWVMGNNFKGSGFYGAYPPAYLRRVLSMFPEVEPGRILHLFSGSLDDSVPGVRFDLIGNEDDGSRHPTVVGDAHDLANCFPADSFDLVLADPPYTDEDAARYGTPAVRRNEVLRQLRSVVAQGGNVVWLDQVLPMFSKRDWHLWGLIGIVRSTNHRFRVASMFRAAEKESPDA